MGKTLGYGEITVANMTEPFTVMLTNEAQQFATDSNRKVTSAQSYYTDIIVIRGSQERTDYTIGNITSGSGITVSKSSKRVTFSVSAGATIGADAGVIEIPITLDGQTVKKQFSWSCGKQGPQGVKGEDGSNFAWNLLKGTGTAKEFTPKGNLTNQTTLFNKLDLSGQTLKEGDKFVISCDLEWTQFTQGTSGTFDYWFQGSVDYSWSYDNIFAQGLQKVQPTKAEILASDGKKHLSAVCTMKQSLLDKKIFEIGIRFDNTDGTGMIKVSNLKIAKEDKESPWCLHPDELKGDKGKSVQSVIEYYLTTSASSGVTTSTSGWSTDPTTQKLTAEKKYLWNCKQTVYDDGTRGGITSPVICGTYGETGKNALHSNRTYTGTYTTVGETAYASTSSFNRTPIVGDIYTCLDGSSNTGTWQVTAISGTNVTVKLLGYVKSKGEDGISPKVSLSKTGDTTTISIVDATGTHTQTVKDGTNGTPGAAGKDGKTSYFHVKYSNDGGKTFTGNSGEDTGIYMGSYTDYTETDSTDVKKYNWVKVKGDKGDTGQKGQDGTSIKITSKSVTYQTSTSGTTAPTGTWSTTVPTVNNGQYLWTKTTVQYSDGNKTEAYSVSYKGTNGTNGTSVTVSKTEVTYQVSTSGTTAPTGTWSTTMPSCDQGQYLWTKTYVKYSDGKETTSYSVSYKGVDGEKFAFNMLRETNQGSKHWDNNASGGKYSVESTTTEDGINAVKIITTEAIPSNGWHYVTFADYKMLKSLTPSTTYTLSFDIWSNQGNHNEWITIQQGSATKAMTSSSYIQIKGNENWQHITTTLTTVASMPEIASQCVYMTGTSAIGYAVIKNLKLTEGTVDTPWAPHPEDLEGRGVSQTVQYYLATSQASGVTSSTSGWSTDITTQKLTADKKYLWNCYQTKYSDGTSEPISTPKVIGVYGDKGQNAKNLSITPSSQYFKSTDGGKTFAPDTITIKPTIQGEISFDKWQYSIDGGVSFADVVSGQKGLTINNNVLTVSKDSSLYSDAVTMITCRAVANDSSFYDTCSIAKIYDVSELEIGGVNLFVKSTASRGWWISNTGVLNADGGWGYSDYIDVSGMKNYIASGFTNLGISPATCFYDSNKTFISGVESKNQNSQDSKRKTLPIPSNAKYMRFSFALADIDTLKIEQGTKATAYSPAPEDLQTAILSTKSEISDVSLKVDDNKQAIEQRVEKNTYQQDLNLIKGDISKANEGLNKWRYEIYPKSLFASEYQGKSTMDVFAKNTNLTPSQSVLINDTDLSIAWNYDNNYIGYALTFTKFSAAKSVAITFAHDDGAHIYLNGKLIGGSDAYSKTGESLTLGFVKGWNCIEVVVNEDANTEGFKLGTTISAISECQLMNCYYGTPVARQSHITNQLVENTTNIKGISTKVSKVTSVIGDNGENFTSFKNEYSDFKQTMNEFEATVGQTYVTKDDFNGLEIGGRNLLWNSGTTTAIQYSGEWNAHGCTATAETRNNCLVSRVNSPWNGYQFNLKKIIERYNLVDGDILTYSIDVKMDEPIDILFVNNYYADNKGCTGGISTVNRWDGKYFTIGKWERLSFTFKITQDTLDKIATDTYRQGVRTAFEPVKATSEGKYVYFACPKLERGTKATDYTEAPEDDEINGQNLVSNLPSNWEQGTFDGNRVDVGGVYNTGKVDNSTRIRVKELVPVSGTITISNAYSNQSKKPIQHVIAALDVNKKYLGNGYINTDWNDFPRIVDMKDAKYIAVIVKYKDNSAMTPSDISQICLKIERGTSATPFTLAPEDVNGKIVNVETIANQTAKKFEWIVKGGDSSSNFTLTDRVADLVAERINFKGLVTFSGLNTDAKNEIGKVAQSKVDGLEVGGRNLLVQKNITQGYLTTDGKGSFINSGGGDQTSDWIDVSGNKYITITLYEDFTNTNNSGRYCEYDADKNCISTIDYNPRQKSSVIIELKSNTKYIRVTAIECKTRRYKIEAGNKATDWTPAPEDVSQDATNKASQALTDAKNYSSNAVNWVTNNGSSTTSLNSMVKKWTDGAVSDTTQINGGWIKANTITASKIALADFTNYSQLTRDTAATYGFAVTDDTDGTWFSTQGIRRDQFISETFPCNGGESYLIEYDISTNAKGANNSTDTKNYIGVAIGVYGYTGTVGSNGLPNKATNIWYATRVTGSEAAAVTHVKTTITTSTATKQFRIFLQSNGYYFEGTTKIRNLSVRRMYGGTLIVDGSITADKIATDAIKSRNYISSGGTQGSFLNLSDGSFQSPNLSWDSNGNLIAKNANISGQITATKGSIAGWTIISDKMYTTGSGKYTGIGKYGSAYAFWAGATSNDNGNSAVFKVGHTGKLTAADVDITGKINATSGSIGNWNIVGSTLYTSPSNNPGVGLSSSYDRYLMWAGETNGANGSSDSNAKFKVSYDGTLRVGASSTAIELVSGKLNLYSSSTYGDRIGSIHTVHKVDTDEYMFGIYSNFKYGWGLYHEDPTNEYVIADMYTRPNNQGVYMPRGFNVSYTDSSGGGQDGYFRIARISITGQYLNCPIELEFIRRGDRSPTKVTIRFNNSDSISPGIAEFYYEGRSNMEIYACDGITIEDNSHTLADIYVKKAEAWDNITVTNVKNSWGYMNTGLDINTAVEFYSSKPNVTHQAENLFDSGWVDCSMGYGISAYNSGSNIRVRKKNGIVFLEGVATNSTTWTEHESIISFREDFAPARSCSFVMQGSGSNRWLLYVQPNGVCTASRYSNNGTMSNTVPKNSWLCMNASWIAK